MFSLLFFATQKLYEQYKPMKKEYINYRIIADKELLEFLRSEEEDRFSKMDALCDLLDKAAGENRESLTYFGTAVTLRKGQFVTTVSNLARQWKWHRRVHRKKSTAGAASKDMRLNGCRRLCGCCAVSRPDRQGHSVTGGGYCVPSGG